MKNREIKFRAYDKNKNKLIFGPTDSNPQPSWILICCSGNDLPLMQYTGLKDKNGKEIYESDILTFDNYINFEIIYQNGSFGYIADPYFKEFISLGQNHHFKWENKRTNKLEIIGNIHQNSELLK